MSAEQKWTGAHLLLAERLIYAHDRDFTLGQKLAVKAAILEAIESVKARALASVLAELLDRFKKIAPDYQGEIDPADEDRIAKAEQVLKDAEVKL